jgi:DeoR/GlpR family transcriptional regulator of sugar metabolism
VAADHRDLAPERQVRLLDLLRHGAGTRVAELCRALDVSAATVRRDLAELQKAGRIRRVHGGALSAEGRLDEPLFDDKTAIASEEKRRIAAAAAELVEAGDTVYLDGGSTVLELARRLAERTDVTVVTNSLRAAVELSGHGPPLVLIGGELRRRSQTVVGPLTRHLLDGVRIRKAFMGTMGVTVEDGLTTSDASEAFTKGLVTSRAEQVILLADRGKIGRRALAKAGDLADLDVLITERGADRRFVRGLRERGVRVIEV